MNVLNLFQKVSSRNVLSFMSLKSEKGVIFLTTKVLVLAKIGGDFPPQKISEKGYLFSARNEHGYTVEGLYHHLSQQMYTILVNTESLNTEIKHLVRERYENLRTKSLPNNFSPICLYRCVIPCINLLKLNSRGKPS